MTERTNATKNSRVTIEDVAEAAGVSIATVSRVVNGRDGASVETIQRVNDVIDELGYASSLVARSLRSATTHIIGIVVSGIEPFSAELLKGASGALERTDYELIVYSGGVDADPGWERRCLSRLDGTLADGVILVAPTVLEVEATRPVIAVDPHIGGDTLPVIDSENFEGAKKATEHLIELGHRDIAFLAGRPGLLSSQRRELGFRTAMDEAGLPVDPDFVRVGGFLTEVTTAPAHELLTAEKRPTAVFAGNDLSALEVMRVARELGLSIPGDLSVVGFDNIPDSALADPPLTTVDQAIRSMGEEAARLLVSLIADPARSDSGNPSRITLPTELVVRRSTAPPGA